MVVPDVTPVPVNTSPIVTRLPAVTVAIVMLPVTEDRDAVPVKPTDPVTELVDCICGAPVVSSAYTVARAVAPSAKYAQKSPPLNSVTGKPAGTTNEVSPRNCVISACSL